MEIMDIIKEITNKLDEKKALDIRIIDIQGISDFADYFVIASASNPNQLNTLRDVAEEVIAKSGVETYNIEGRNDSTWILIDCMDFIVHLFDKDQREFYNLEHMWQDGKFVDIEQFLPKR